MRRWLISALALLAGAGTTVTLLWYADPGRASASAYVLVRDVPAGSPIGLDAVRLEPVRVPSDVRPPLGAGSRGRIATEVAAHDLASGQLLAPSDLVAAGDRRLVTVAVKQAPPVAPGDRVDLLLVTGTGDRVGVAPFAQSLEVRAVTAGGLVVSVSSRAAAGLIYAGATAQLVAVVAERGGRGGQEPSVGSLEEAAAAVRP